MKNDLSSVAAGILAFSLGPGVHAASEAYKAAMERADANYFSAKAHCNTLSGGAKKDCIKQAQANYKSAEAQAMTRK